MMITRWIHIFASLLALTAALAVAWFYNDEEFVWWSMVSTAALTMLAWVILMSKVSAAAEAMNKIERRARAALAAKKRNENKRGWFK